MATISCKVGDVTIPYAMIDSGSDSSIVSENIAKHLGLKIDRKKIHRLNGVISKSHSLGMINIVPVTIENGENRDTIPDEFSVVPTEYDDNGKELSLFILGMQWQYQTGWKPLVKGEFKVTQNGKTITILLSVHKSQRNVFTVGKKKKLSLPWPKAGDRTCQHCGKEFCYPSNLRQHFLRKNLCAVVESHARPVNLSRNHVILGKILSFLKKT